MTKVSSETTGDSPNATLVTSEQAVSVTGILEWLQALEREMQAKKLLS